MPRVPVVGYVEHDEEIVVEDPAGVVHRSPAGVWSVLGCRDGHLVEGRVALGEEVECQACDE